MAAKKKSRKKPATRIPKASVRTTKTSARKKSGRNKSVQKKSVQKKSTPKAKSMKRVATSGKTPRTTPERQKPHLASSAREKARMREASADSQGLSNLEQADSESVTELLDEGNTFEAGAVMGVEQADDADPREVHTRELPEDDVPEEYLDKD